MDDRSRRAGVAGNIDECFLLWLFFRAAAGDGSSAKDEREADREHPRAFLDHGYHAVLPADVADRQPRQPAICLCGGCGWRLESGGGWGGWAAVQACVS